jgi:uncharacterized membrane protein YdjX (TVP38/TMEM64 family)
MPPKTRNRLIVLAAVAVAVIVLALSWNTDPVVLIRSQMGRDNIETWVNRAGLWGPVLVVVLMVIAVVASPIPSAPIALAAGAAYGHTWGAVYVVIGAESGALVAFGLARVLGRGVLEHWFGDRLNMGLLGSQNALTLTVLASRLMPFISFDLVSYAAGLSCLHFWRFGLATLAGIIPASFLLAHFGGAVASAEIGNLTWIVLGLGLITGLPLLWAMLHRWRKKNT